MNIVLPILKACLIGYLLGSVSNGVLIGKIFFNIDVRTQGSHNAGGTNTGRVLGKKYGLLTIVLDILKTVLAVWITYFITSTDAISSSLGIAPYILAYIAGLFACIGHMYPVFFGFKGGKVVSCFGGLLLATNWLLFLIGVSIFMIILVWKKYVSLSSMIASSVVAILTFIPFLRDYGMIFGFEGDIYFSMLFVLTAKVLIIRHHENIKRLINGTESKVKWLDKKN